MLFVTLEKRGFGFCEVKNINNKTLVFLPEFSKQKAILLIKIPNKTSYICQTVKTNKKGDITKFVNNPKEIDLEKLDRESCPNDLFELAESLLTEKQIQKTFL